MPHRQNDREALVGAAVRLLASRWRLSSVRLELRVTTNEADARFPIQAACQAEMPRQHGGLGI
jgi:hypothetical protein